MARPPRIELGSQASEAYVISIGPRAHIKIAIRLIIGYLPIKSKLALKEIASKNDNINLSQNSCLKNLLLHGKLVKIDVGLKKLCRDILSPLTIADLMNTERDKLQEWNACEKY